MKELATIHEAECWYDDRREEWRKGTKNSSMFLVTCVPCIPMARLMEHLSMASYPMAILTLFLLYAMFGLFLVLLIAYSASYASLALLVAYTLLGCLMLTVRSQFRTQHNLQGASMDDCCLSFFCCTTSIYQMNQHLDAMSESSLAITKQPSAVAVVVI